MTSKIGYEITEPLEIHYSQDFGRGESVYILTAFVNSHGMVQYTLCTKGSHYPNSIPAGTFPRKAVDGWQSQVIATLMSDERQCMVSGCIEILKLV